MRGVCFALWIFLACAVGTKAAPGWRWSNPAPHGATIFDITSLGSMVVEVGELGQVFTSDDLDSWMPRRTGVTNSLRAAEFFGGRVVIAGSEGLILYTHADAMSNYIKLDLNTGDWLEGLAAGGGRLVAVGDNGAIYTSLDAAAWERRPDAGDWLTSVAYGGGKFVAVGFEGYVTTSDDGLNWNGSRITTTNLTKAAYLGDRFWILGEGGFVRTSDTGTNWTVIDAGTTNDLFDVTSDDLEVVLVGSSELRVSPPPYAKTNWISKISEEPQAPPAWTYYAAHWDGSQFLVAGRSGMVVEGFRTNATAQTEWFTFDESPRNWIWSLTSVDGLFAACGESGGIFTSVDGFHFEQENVPLAAQSEILEGIGGTTNLLVAVGTGGTILYSVAGFTNVVITNATGTVTQQVSSLGVNWKEANVPLLYKVEYQGVGVSGSNYIVSGADGTILTSDDGLNWTPRLSGVSRMLSSVTASPTRVVAVGDIGSVTTSNNDGATWTKRTSGVTNWIYQARFLNGQFVAVGEAGLILTSPDGVAWTKRNSGTTAWLNAVTRAGGNFLAVGTGGIILKSPDAVNWSPTPQITTKSLYGIAANSNRIVAAGLEGAIIRNTLGPFPHPVDFLRVEREGEGFAFLLKGELDQRFTVSGTSDFATWGQETELEITDNSGVLIFFQGLGRTNRQFYRTKVLPE